MLKIKKNWSIIILTNIIFIFVFTLLWAYLIQKLSELIFKYSWYSILFPSILWVIMLVCLYTWIFWFIFKNKFKKWLKILLTIVIFILWILNIIYLIWVIYASFYEYGCSNVKFTDWENLKIVYNSNNEFSKYKIEKNKICVKDEGWFVAATIAKWTDIETFEFLVPSNYLYESSFAAKDKNNVYLNKWWPSTLGRLYRAYEILEWTTPETFEFFKDSNWLPLVWYAKDKNYIYNLNLELFWTQRKKLEWVDYNTFEALEDDKNWQFWFAKDKNNVYHWWKAIKWADPQTFETLWSSTIAKDKNYTYELRNYCLFNWVCWTKWKKN
jgi:hypothetical protein